MKWSLFNTVLQLENLIRTILNNKIKEIKFCTEHNLIFNIDNVIKMKDYSFYNSHPWQDWTIAIINNKKNYIILYFIIDNIKKYYFGE